MRNAYHRVLTEYQDQKTKTFKPSENPLSTFMVNEMPKILIRNIRYRLLWAWVIGLKHLG